MVDLSLTGPIWASGPGLGGGLRLAGDDLVDLGLGRAPALVPGLAGEEHLLGLLGVQDLLAQGAF
ncbi:MAG: hypothetical protein ACHQ7M_18995, partial [Chloroflexota bacterium]